MTRISQTATTQRNASTLRRGLRVAAVALVGLLTLPTSASAQTRPPRSDGDRADQYAAELAEALNLDDAQASRLRALFEAQEANRPSPGARRGGSPDNREAVRAEREAQRAEMDRQVEAILTPAQVERYRSLRTSRQPRGRQDHNRQRRNGR